MIDDIHGFTEAGFAFHSRYGAGKHPGMTTQ
jgi:hypothetical protein